jgi:hypothetical protein
MRKNLLISGVIAMAMGPVLANATTSVSVASLPQGMVVISTGAVGSTNYISLPLSSNAVFTGSVSSVGPNTINVSNNPFTMNLANIGSPYFVKFLSGNEAGRTLLITSSTSNSLTVSTTDNSSQSVNLQTSNFSVGSGDMPEVQVMVKTTGNNAITYVSTGYPVGMTLSQLNFGSNWLKGTSTATADVVSVWNSSTKAFVSYYETPSSGWCKVGSPTADQGSTVLPAGCCLALQQHLTVSGATSYLTLSAPYSVSNL